MFSFFRDNLEQTQRICDAIIKTYASPIQSPKYFYQNNPKLKIFSELLEPPSYKQKQLQEIVKDKISRPFDLEIILGTELELNQQLPDNWFEIFPIYLSEQNNDSSSKEFIFQFAERVLIKTNYQLKYLVNFFNSSPNINDDTVISHIPKLLTFFLENSDYMNQTFFDILASFYGHVNYQWKSIFYNNSYILRKFASLIFISASKLVPYESHNTYNASFSFIKDVFSQAYRNYTDFYLRPQLLVEFQRSLIYIVEKSTNQQKAIICQMICNLLQEAPTFLVDFANALLNLTNCTRIYKSCLIGLETEKIISTFQIILEYVVWVIMKFPESSVLNNSNIRFPKVSFSNIDTDSYAKKTVILPQKVKSVLNPSFGCIPSILSEIIESNEETKIVILKEMRDYLVKCQPTINWDHFSSQIFKSNIEEEDDNENKDDETNDTSNSKEKSDKNETENQNRIHANPKLKDKNDLDNESSDYWTPVNEVQFLDDSDTPNEYSHFRALLCFFIEVTKKIKNETIFSFYFRNFEEFKQDWAPLLLTYIYPTNSHLIGHLFYKCYTSIPTERKLFLDEISFLIDNRNQQHLEVSLLVFIPLINLLFIEFLDFGTTFVSSQLLKSLIRESRKSNRIFLLLSSIIYKYPIECFTSSTLTNFITDSFDDPSFHKTFVKCLINGLKYCGQKKDSTEIRLLLNHITALLPTLLAKKYKKSYDLIDILASTIPSFDSDNISLFFQIRILDLVADSCKNDPSEQMFRSAFQFFIALSRTSNQNLLRMSNPKSSIFSTFTEIFEKNRFDFDIVDVLFDFAIIPYKCASFQYFKEKESIINNTFVNPMAATLIFKWIEGRDNELEVVKDIFSMTDAHVVNAFQLQKADIPMLILTRISKINDEVELVNRYFDLLYNIWKQGMPISDAYSAISTMKTIRFPHLIIDSFFRLLRQEKKDHNIFYWLNGIDSGFSGTKITFDKSIETLFISFQCFIDEVSMQNKALVFIQNEKGDTIEFGIHQTKIYFDYNGQNKSYFKSEILVNVWHHMTFAINCKKIRLILCEKIQEQKTIKVSRKKSLRYFKERKMQDETAIPEDLYDPEVFTCPSFFNQSINLYIGRRDDKMDHFSGLIGSIFVFNDYISYTHYLQISKLALLNNDFPNLIASYVPRIVEDSDTIHVSNDLTAEFHGLTLTSYQSIHSVITNTNVLDCLLPFYNKIISCKSCNGTEEYCAKCGRLGKENGRKLLYSLTSIITHLLTVNNCTVVNKAPHSIIELLSQYFTRIDTIFFTNEFISTFKSLFEIVQSKDLDLEADVGQKMVEEIWLNYEMISRFPPELQMRYFSMDLVKVFAQNEDYYKLFNSFTSYDFLIHKLLLFFTNSELNVAKIAWQITLECILKNSITTATALLGLSFSPETAPVSEQILNFIELLEKTSNPHMISVLQIFDSLLPFAIWASRPPLQSQRKALNYILGQNNRSIDEMKTALMQVAFLYEPPMQEDALFQVVLRHFQNGCNEIYPLLIRVISNFTKKDLEANSSVIASIISPEKYSKIPHFPYFVLSLVEVCMKQEIQSIDSSHIFGKFITLEFNEKRYESLEKLRCLMMLYGAENKIDFRNLVTKVLEYLFEYYRKSNEKTAEILGHVFGNFFVHLFFKTEISLNEPEKNFLTKYSSHFCTFSHKPQISFEFTNTFQSAFQVEVLNNFITFIPKKAFEVRLSDGFMMESSQLIAYTLLKLCESGSKLDNAVKEFVKSSKGNKNALNIIRNYNCQHTSKLKGDDPKQFLDAFELSFTLIAPQLKHSIQTQFSKVSDEIVNYLLKTMETSISSTPSTTPPFSEAHPLLHFLHSIESKSAQNLLNIYKKYRQNMTIKFNNKKIANARKSTVFFRELHIFCGPWFDTNGQNKLHFKIKNGFCIDGSRALMKVDNKHDFAKHISPNEKFSNEMNGTLIPAKLLTIKSSYIGNISAFPDRLTFTGEFAHIDKRKIDIYLSDILYVFQRVIPNGSTGIEIFVTGIKSYLFEIPPTPREHLLSFIETNALSTNYFNYIFTNKYNFFNELIKITGKKVQRLGAAELYKLSGLFEAFDSHIISTYSYIFYLNIISGRSLNCLMIYPVFPWVISDYKSEEIDLNNPEIYRDFRKPTCLLNNKQMKHNKKIVENNEDQNIRSPHFSNPFIVCGLLKRIEPFGSIDSIINNENEPRRPKSFDSISETWESVSNDIYDNRELTPEFYSNEFIFKESYAPCCPKNKTSAFTSTSNLTQSMTQIDNSFTCFQINYQAPSSLIDNEANEEEEDKNSIEKEMKLKTIDDQSKKGKIQRVVLPPWSKGKTSNFIKVNRAALESEYTRRSIHDWIDLMFGIKSELWFDKSDWNVFDICQKSPDFIQSINTTDHQPLYSEDGSLSKDSEVIITQVYPDFCYQKNLNNQSGQYGICPQNVILEPVSECKPYIPQRPTKLQTQANQVLRIRKSYALQSDFTILNYIKGTSATTQPIQNMKFFEVSEEMDMVFMASPYELYVKAIVFNKATEGINSSDNKTRRRTYSTRNREQTRSSPNLNTNMNIDLNANSNVNSTNNINISIADENTNINSNSEINNNQSCYDKEFENVSEIFINHEAAPISSISVVKNVLVSATTDGTIRRWLLPHFVVCRKTNLHYCSVIAIGGSLSLNVLVSIDVFGQVVIESLMNSSSFSLCTKLKRVYKTNFIHVFKSGKVAIIQSDQEESCVTLLNMEGRIVNERKFDFCIQEFDSVSNTILLEKLLIGYKSDTIELLDIPSLTTQASYHGLIPNMKFNRAKNSNDSVYAFTGTKIELLSLTMNQK